MLPDLMPIDLSSDKIGKAGANVKISNTVLNDGKGDSGPFYVSLYLSPDMMIDENEDLLVGNGKIEKLLAGKQSEGTAVVPIPATIKPGSYYFGIIVDLKNEVTESDETNNKGHSTIPIVIQT
jgi:subtilase family serine protease